jgi:hypothetical protein
MRHVLGEVLFDMWVVVVWRGGCGFKIRLVCVVWVYYFVWCVVWDWCVVVDKCY